MHKVLIAQHHQLVSDGMARLLESDRLVDP